VGTFDSSTASATTSGSGSSWNNSNNLYVGDVGDATLNIMSGGAVTSKSGFIGTYAQSTSVVTIDGNGSNWTSSVGSLYVGDLGNGTLNLTAGGNLNYDTVSIGNQAGSTGVATVSGSGSVWSNPHLYVGNAGTGTLNISAGGSVLSTDAYIGDDVGSNGAVTINGSDSRWTNGGNFVVGNSGAGALNIISGLLQSRSAYIGYNAGSNGIVTIDGVNSFWGNIQNHLFPGDELTVGYDGTGTLRIINGGRVSFGQELGTSDQQGVVWIGKRAGSNGTVDVAGTGSMLTSPNGVLFNLVVGGEGTGKLSISSGGRVGSESATIGDEAGGTGTVTIDGIGSLWSTRFLFLRKGTLTVTNGGLLTALENVRISAPATIRGNGRISAAGGVRNAGVVAPGNSPGALTITGDYTQLAGGTLEIELASPSSYDQLLVSGATTLGGTLAVSLLDGYMPSVGESFSILTSNGLNGTFSTLTFPSISNHLAFDVAYNSAGVTLSIVPALPGDFDADGDVDGADYVVWRKNSGNPTAYNTWRTHFGQTAGSGSTAASFSESAIPEPASIVLLLIAAANTMPDRRRRNK
jgi:T5SS/PEP-CTERM-associated repeat protein